MRASCRSASNTVGAAPRLPSVFPSCAGLLTDRTAFIKIVCQETAHFRPFGKFVAEFTRQVEVKAPQSLFESLAGGPKRPTREV